jgi:hypothetical protein
LAVVDEEAPMLSKSLALIMYVVVDDDSKIVEYIVGVLLD